MRANWSCFVSVFLIAIVTMALLAFLVDAGRPSADLTVSLNDRSYVVNPAADEPDSSRLRFAVAAVLSPSATISNYQAFALYLSDRLQRPVDLVQGKSYAEINSLVRTGEADFALVCSGAYIVGKQDFGMVALVVPVVEGKTTYRSYLVVNSDSDAADWEDLRHGTFAFSDPLSNSGRLVPVQVLADMDESPELFFKDFIFTYSHDRSIQAVADGLVDAAAVDSLVYDFMARNDAEIASNTRVIWKSRPYGINPVVVNPNIDPEFRDQLESVFTGMNTDPQGEAVLALLGIDSFVLPETGAYDEIEQMIAAAKSR